MLYARNVCFLHTFVTTIHHLTYEDCQQSLSFSYRIGKSTISKIIDKTCVALWKVLKGLYINSRTTLTEWEKTSDEIFKIWNLPYCVGAINRIYFAITSPLKISRYIMLTKAIIAWF